MSKASTSGRSEAQTLLQHQQQQIERKFAKIKALRREAYAVRRDSEQKQRNKETDQQILLLMQTDERLASLLSEAADSMRALLPASDQEAGPSHGAKAFESKAQQWFSVLNEVQYSLRTAVRHLRDSQLAPLTAPCGPEARQSGLAGSAGQGHSISLFEAFVDMSSAEATASNVSSSISPLNSFSEAQLSLPALRERDRNWKELSRSLEEIVKTYTHSGSSKPDISALSALVKQISSDKVLLEALLNTTSSSK